MLVGTLRSKPIPSDLAVDRSVLPPPGACRLWEPWHQLVPAACPPAGSMACQLVLVNVSPLLLCTI